MAAAPMGTALQQIQRLFVEGRLASLPDGELLERFLSERDEAAFAALVERHGPMVLGTCRAVLRDVNAAEDAFQATFLVLVGKARSIRGRGALASWLYLVARRIAIQAGAEAARRRKRERLAGQPHATDGHAVEPDDRVARDPPRRGRPALRAVSAAPVALRAGGKDPRPGRRRAQLRRGDRPAAADGRPRHPSIPADPSRRGPDGRCARNSTRPLGPGDSPPGMGRGDRQGRGGDELDRRADRRRRDRLDDGRGPRAQSLHAMLWSQLRAAAASVVFLIALVGMAWGVGTYGQDKAGVGQAPRMPNPRSTPEGLPAPAKTEKPADPIGDRHVSRAGPRRGRASPAGRRLVRDSARVPEPVSLARPRHQRDGRPLPVRRAEIRFRYVLLGCSLERGRVLPSWHGPLDTPSGWRTIRDDAEELTLQLPHDDVPISGRIIDLQGQPVVGAMLSVIEVGCPAGGSLDELAQGPRRTQGVPHPPNGTGSSRSVSGPRRTRR